MTQEYRPPIYYYHQLFDMRDFQEIYDEVKAECLDNNCQSTNSMAILAMEKVKDEYKADIIEKLEGLSNSYEVIGDVYVVKKNALDVLIHQIDANF